MSTQYKMTRSTPFYVISPSAVLSVVLAGLLFTFALAAAANEQEAFTVFKQARTAYEGGNYAKASRLLLKTKSLLGSTNVRIQPMLIKSLAKTGDITRAKREIKNYYALNPSKDLVEYQEIVTLESEIDRKLAAEAARREAARQAEIRRLQAERAQQEAERLAELQRQEALRLAELQRQEEARQAELAKQEAARKAAIRRKAAARRAANQDLQKANNGDVSAMLSLARRYQTGIGVNKSQAKAKQWERKSQARKNEIAEQRRRALAERSARREANRVANVKREIENTHYFPLTNRALDVVSNRGGMHPVNYTSILLASPFLIGVAPTYDIVSSNPTDATKTLSYLRDQIALSPSSWGNPKSLLAQAAKLRE